MHRIWKLLSYSKLETWLIVPFRSSIQIDLLRKWIKIYRSRLISEEEGLVGKHVGENFEIGATELGYLFWSMHTHTLRLHFFRTLEQVLILCTDSNI